MVITALRRNLWEKAGLCRSLGSQRRYDSARAPAAQTIVVVRCSAAVGNDGGGAPRRWGGGVGGADILAGAGGGRRGRMIDSGYYFGSFS